MQTQKMSLANIKGKLTRHEMKIVMAGLEDDGGTISITGTRWNETTCFCDFTTTINGLTQHFCDIYCSSSNCGH